MVSVPEPSVVLLEATAGAAMVCALASELTSTLKLAALAVLLVVTPTALLLDFPVVVRQKSVDASLAATSRNLDSALLILPTSEICDWIFVSVVSSCLSGCRSMAISCVMIELTSSPLPMPGELMVAMMLPLLKDERRRRETPWVRSAPGTNPWLRSGRITGCRPLWRRL